MTAESVSWGKRHQLAKDEAWAAWRRVGVEPFAIVFKGSPRPEPLEKLARALAEAMVPIIVDVLDELGHQIDDDGRQRALVGAVADSVAHVPWAVVEAIADELARPEPLPFVPPPSGAWIRCRSTAPWKRDGQPAWEGVWHVFAGDWQPGDLRSHGIGGRARCGVRLQLRGDGLFEEALRSDFVVADDGQPGVDACKRCARVSRS